MSTVDEIVSLAAAAHRQVWSPGKDVSEQTRKAQTVCKVWQASVLEQFGERFQAEHGLNERGPAQKIDLLDVTNGVAYELKVSPNNVHMEIYRDVFKALVFNERNPSRLIRTLVFIAPEAGMQQLGESFPKDVQAIAAKLGLQLVLRALP